VASDSLPVSAGNSRALLIVWVVSFVVSGFAAASIWLGPWLTNRFHRFHSLTPTPPSTTWMVAFAGVSVGCVLLVIGQILLTLRKNSSRLAKVSAAVAVTISILLSAQWFRVSSGEAFEAPQARVGRPHTVTLTWKPSPSKIVGYNVYRRTPSSGEYLKLTPTAIPDITFTDKNVVSGLIYDYSVTAVDSHNAESAHSAHAYATIP